MIAHTGRVRIADVAREADVSTATVDRVLNKRAGVRAVTSDRVWTAIARLQRGPEGAPNLHVVPTPLTMDFVIPHGAGPTFDENLQEAVRATAAARGATLRWHRFESFNPGALAELVMEIGRRGTDGIAIHALEHPLVREAVDRVTANGTPVIAFLSDLVGSQRLAYVGMDNRAGGRTSGYLLGRFLPKAKGKVALLAGSHMYRAHDEREMGFRGVCREYFPWLEVLDLVIGNDQADDNYRKVQTLIEAHPDLVGIYNLGSGSRGVVKALREAGMDQRIVFVIHNLTSVSRSFLLDGSVDAVLHLNMARMVEAATDLVRRSQARGQVRSSLLPFKVVLRENIPS